LAGPFVVAGSDDDPGMVMLCSGPDRDHQPIDLAHSRIGSQTATRSVVKA
jgi:hypothetical protein